MLPVVTNGVVWFVSHDCEPCKSSRTDRDAIWDVDSVGSRTRNYVFDGVQIPSCKGAILRREMDGIL